MLDATNIIPANTTKIIADFGDGIVAAQHANGYVGIFDADVEEDMLFQVSPALIRPAEGVAALDVANEMMAAA